GQLLGRRGNLTNGIEQFRGFLQAVLAHQRHADVETRVGRPCIAAIADGLPTLERLDRFVVVIEIHHHLRFEQVTLRLQIAGQRAMNRGERVGGLLQVLALIPDLREVEPRAIANVEWHVVVEQRAEDAARFLVKVWYQREYLQQSADAL